MSGGFTLSARVSDDAPNLTPDVDPEAPKKTVRKVAKKAARKTARKVAKEESAGAVETTPEPVAAAPRTEAPPQEAAPVVAPQETAIERPSIPSNVRVVSQTPTAHHSAPETIGGGDSESKSKRRRRRKKKGGVGQGQGNGAPVAEAQMPLVNTEPKESAVVSPPSVAPVEPQPHRPRVAHDREAVARRAWKIFLGEVSEEGLSLINDNDAREIARRSFRLAEIFLDEQARRF